MSTWRLRLAVPFVGLGMVLAVGYGFYRLVYLIVSSLFELLPALDPTVIAALIATMTTAIVSVLSIVYSQRKTKEREIAESHRQQKIDLYKGFMDNFVVGALRLAKEKADASGFQKHTEAFFLEFTANLIVWGSPEVIHEYTKLRKSGNQPQILLQIDDVLRAIREDLGHRNRRIGRGDLIALFLTDPERLKELTQVDK